MRGNKKGNWVRALCLCATFLKAQFVDFDIMMDLDGPVNLGKTRQFKTYLFGLILFDLRTNPVQCLVELKIEEKKLAPI
jgi:hypothetical protein